MKPRSIATRITSIPRRASALTASVFANIALAAGTAALAIDGTSTLRALSPAEWAVLGVAAALVAGFVLLQLAPAPLPVEQACRRRPAVARARAAYGRAAIPTALLLSLTVLGLARLPASNTIWSEQLALQASVETAEWTPTPDDESAPLQSFSVPEVRIPAPAGPGDTASNGPPVDGSPAGTKDPSPTGGDPTKDAPPAETETPTDSASEDLTPPPDPRPEPAESSPYLVVGPSTCADIRGEGASDWHEAVIDGGDLVDGLFGPASDGFEVTIENFDGASFDWWSNQPVQVVVVEADGGDSSVYAYDDPNARRGVGLTVPSALRDIGRIAFCYEPADDLERPGVPAPATADSSDDPATDEEAGGTPQGDATSTPSVETPAAERGRAGIAWFDDSPQPTPIGPTTNAIVPGRD